MVLDVQRRTETVQDCGIGADSVKTGSLVIIDNKVSYLIENNRQKHIEVNDRSDFTHYITLYCMHYINTTISIALF